MGNQGKREFPAALKAVSIAVSPGILDWNKEAVWKDCCPHKTWITQHYSWIGEFPQIGAKAVNDLEFWKGDKIRGSVV